jgi:molecular chaperone GrpE
MSENNMNPKPESPDLPPGFTEVSGPAAFKAQQKAAEEQAIAAAAQEGATAPTSPAEDYGAALVQKVAELETALASANDTLLRTVADMENLRKRSVREREDASKYAVSGFAKDLLDVADTFRRALSAIPADLREDARILPLIEGIEATERALLASFERNGIKKIEPLDEPFNPNFHEVMFEAPVPGKPGGVIIQLIEPGYLLHDRLLRPARVGVAKADPNGNSGHALDTQA